jgi:CDP-6-deoxy-D-xylo-4-hexulose-3-dehydrase
MRKIFLADDTIDKNELNSLSNWIKKGERLTKGPLCIEFEKEFAKWQGSKYAVFVNSGSSANLLVAQALLEANYLKNKTIIAPCVSWVTTVTPFMQLGYDVKLCDCDKNDIGLDLKHFEQLCKDHSPSAVILVHVLGHANQMDEIKAICKKYGVKILEDACESLGSTYKGKKLGSIGLTGQFSLYYGHHISTIEGGIVVTDDEDLYNIMLSIRSHGWGRDIPPEVHHQWKKDYNIDEVRDLYTFYYSGFNLRSTDLNAFLGLSQIKKLDEIGKKRQENFKIYQDLLADFWCQTSQTEFNSSFAYATIIENRLETYTHLKKNGIESRPLICGNIGLHPFWIKKNGKCSQKNADLVHNNGVYLPNHFNLSKDDIGYVCQKFKEVAKPFKF